MSFTAPTGTNFRTVPDIPIASLRQSLDAITEFLKSRDVHGYVLRFDDWWRRDTKPVSQGALFWEDYIDQYRSHAATEPLPKQDKIDMGIGGAEMEWYLRYLADPSAGGASVELTIPREWEADFLDLTEELAPIVWVRTPAEVYYRLIRLRDL